MRRIAIWALLAGCGADPDVGTASTATSMTTDPCPGGSCEDTTTGSGTSGPGSTTASTTAGESTTTGTDSAATMATFNPISDSGMDDDGEAESTAAVDCGMTADCAACWACAKAGPCNAGYAACEAAFNCIPSLICAEQCANDGLTQECVGTCCMSCSNLMTCPTVDGVISCIETACAGQCGMVTCP